MPLKKEIADVVASEDKTSNQAQDIEVKSANTKDKMDFLSIQPEITEQPSLPEKNQTETVNSALTTVRTHLLQRKIDPVR